MWGPAKRRDGASEWPSTSFSTFTGQLDDLPRVKQRRKLRAGYATLAFAFMLILLVSAAGVVGIARHLPR